MKVGSVAKFIVGAIGVIVAAVVSAVTDDTITADEVGLILTTILTAFGVYVVPNSSS